MKPQFAISIAQFVLLGTIALPVLTPLQESQKEAVQSTAKSANPADRQEVEEPTIEQLKTEMKQLQETNEIVVQKLMRAVHRGADAPLVVLEKIVKQEADKPNWEIAQAKSEMIAIMADSLAMNPNRKSYLEAANGLNKAAKDKSLEKLKGNLIKLRASCGACHGWVPPA